MNGKIAKKDNINCTVSIFPRIHLTLIGMDRVGYRLNGGIGFSIAKPFAKISVSKDQKFSLKDNRKSPLQPNELSRLSEIAEKYAKIPVKIKISGTMPSHIGFGSATGIRLATIEAIAKLKKTKINKRHLIRTSCRGGTSGIGITTYFDGRFVFDLGISNVGQNHFPSSSLEGEKISPLIFSIDKMPNWKIGICVPFNIKSQTDDQENAFFKKTCPLSTSSTKNVLYEVVYGICASIREQDFKTFCHAVQSLQKCAWKKSERKLYGKPLLLLERKIYRAGAAAVGMSSLGPCLFFFASDINRVVKNLKKAYPKHMWIATNCHNSGRTLYLK